MSRSIAFLVGLFLSTTVSRVIAADAPLTAKEAAAKVGEKVIVEFVIQSAGRNAEFQELYSDKDWKADDCFFIRFSGPARERFSEVNISDVAAHFLEETVRVTGEVKVLTIGNFKKPVIYVEQIEQVELVSTLREFTPTEKYQKRVLAGFTVLIHPEVIQQKKPGLEAIQFIEGQLKTLNSTLPKDKLELLHKVRIWMEWEGRKNGAAEFHPSAVWLKRNGLNPAKAGCVEVSNARNFVQWNRDKNVSGMLHEMSHALHHLHLGPNNERILAAYRQAKDRKFYDSVSFVQGGRIQNERRQAYAMNNDKEYFAEISEAYFGHNDFFPFNRDQLKSHDPVGFELVKEAWLKPIP